MCLVDRKIVLKRIKKKEKKVLAKHADAWYNFSC